ncbi:MAG: T9SS type A sorting domain-containing protein [Cyclobacteriaceae bacterium]
MVNQITRSASFLITTLLLLVSAIANAQTFVPGSTYYDETGYVEYRAGNLPIIISAPHGGDLEPDSIPDRTCENCNTIKDTYTQEISEGMYQAINSETGCYPHLIINLLHRVKFDANRDIDDAADGNTHVEQAWNAYHQFIDSAKHSVTQEYGRGLFLDMHAHGHEIQRIELGYLLSSSDLRLDDVTLNKAEFIAESAINTLAKDNISKLTHAQLLRGAQSFGSLLHDKGFPSVPSTTDPFPQVEDKYFDGGYNTERHSSFENNGPIDGIQVELNKDIRFDDAVRKMLIDSMSKTTLEYYDLHYNSSFLGNYCGLLIDLSANDNSIRQVNIFPNPAQDYFGIDESLQADQVEIYNHLGQLLLMEKYSGQAIKIDELKTGNYIVLLKREGEIVGTAKLIKSTTGVNQE